MKPPARSFAAMAVFFLLSVGITPAGRADDHGPMANLPKLVTLAEDGRLQLSLGEPVVVMTDGGYQPYLFCTAQGTLFCQAQLDEKPFHSKPKRVYHMRIGSAISRDQGRTWQPWTRDKNHDDVFIEGGGVACADGTIILLDTFVMLGKQADHGIGEVWRSRDDLRTLEGPSYVDFYLPTVEQLGTDDRSDIMRDYARLHRSVIEMPNGELLALVYSTFAGDNAPAGYLATMFKSRNVLVRSRDRGASWQYVSTIAVDSAVGTEGFDEGALVRVSQGRHVGRLLVVMRTGREMYGTHSDDNGKTWVHPRPVSVPGVDIYDTAKWERRFVDPDKPGYVPTEAMYGNMVDPDLTEMRDGTIVCAVGIRIPARLSIFQDWRALENGNYLLFSLDGGDTWSKVVRYTSGAPTTHYAGVREVAPGVLYVVYDNSIWKEHNHVDIVHATLGFSLAVRRAP